MIKRSNREARLLVRRSLIGAGLVGSFWLIWYLLLGTMPVARECQLGPTWMMPLPLALPRWCDCLIFPLWLTAFFLLQQDGRVTRAELIRPLRKGLRVVFLVGLTAIGISATMHKIAIGAEIGIVWGTMAGGLTAGLMAGLGVSLGTSLSSGLRASAICALWAGLPIALIFGLVNGLLATLTIIAVISPTVFVYWLYRVFF